MKIIFPMKKRTLWNEKSANFCVVKYVRKCSIVAKNKFTCVDVCMWRSSIAQAYIAKASVCIANVQKVSRVCAYVCMSVPCGCSNSQLAFRRAFSQVYFAWCLVILQHCAEYGRGVSCVWRVPSWWYSTYSDILTSGAMNQCAGERCTKISKKKNKYVYIHMPYMRFKGN